MSLVYLYCPFFSKVCTVKELPLDTDANVYCHCLFPKGELQNQKSKTNIFCALSQNYQHRFFFRKMTYTSYSKLSKELKIALEFR